MTEDIDRLAIRRANKASTELEATQAAFADLRNASVEALIATQPEDAAKRERLIVTCQILDAVRVALEAMVIDGQTAAVALGESGLTRR